MIKLIATDMDGSLLDDKKELPAEFFDVLIKLREKGVAFNSEPFAIATGTAVEFEDPFGNRLGITDYIKR